MRSKFGGTALVCLLMFVAGCDVVSPVFECENRLRSAHPSHDKALVAELYDVQCGATTEDATWLLLRTAGRPKFDMANRVAVFEGTDVWVNWESGGLRVSYRESTLFDHRSSSHGVRITFVDESQAAPDDRH